MLVKIYTRTGDKGETSLIGGKRVSKSSLRIEAYGSIDELNSSIGLALSFIEEEEIKEVLSRIQNDLFILGSDLADPSYPENPSNIPRISEIMVQELEAIIDKYEEETGRIQYFILPGGSKEAAFLHIARSISRRAERSIVALSSNENVNPVILAYINRLSDLLFVLARFMNKRRGISDTPWRR